MTSDTDAEKNEHLKQNKKKECQTIGIFRFSTSGSISHCKESTTPIHKRAIPHTRHNSKVQPSFKFPPPPIKPLVVGKLYILLEKEGVLSLPWKDRSLVHLPSHFVVKRVQEKPPCPK
ncbi:hypothetical protein KIL84_021663 [Mauremys mutica]|uniref:Uncharacterized protein n=1 Tax=Mauremys mutica TaxID=74926 RepID=A0A9D3X7C9_9SAUR|nr:hypothetical protein KIL84_021663 [Mauremys mutica]